MKKGDTIYYVNFGRNIDIFTVDHISDDNLVHIECKLENNNVLKTSFYLKDFNEGKLTRLFTDKNEATKYKNNLEFEYEKERQATFDLLLEEALRSVTLFEVEKFGVILKTKKSDYEAFYSDAPGGTWLEANIYLYHDKQYIVAYKYTEDIHGNITKECIKFSERIF